MGALDVALGLTRNKLDLARDGKGALGKAFRQRFEAEGYRFGPSGRITHGTGQGAAPLELTPGRGRQGTTPSGQEALGAVTRLAGEPRGTAKSLGRFQRGLADRLPEMSDEELPGLQNALAEGGRRLRLTAFQAGDGLTRAAAEASAGSLAEAGQSLARETRLRQTATPTPEKAAEETPKEAEAKEEETKEEEAKPAQEPKRAGFPSSSGPQEQQLAQAGSSVSDQDSSGPAVSPAGKAVDFTPAADLPEGKPQRSAEVRPLPTYDTKLTDHSGKVVGVGPRPRISDPQQWEDHLDALDGLDIPEGEHRAYREIFSAEGGLKPHEGTMGGIQEQTFRDIVTDGGREFVKELGALGVTIGKTKPQDLTPEQRAQVYSLKFDSIWDAAASKSLGPKIGKPDMRGHEVLDYIGNAEAAAALADTYFRGGRPGVRESYPGYIAQKAINKTLEAQGEPPITLDGNFGSGSIETYKRLSENPETRKLLLDNLADERRKVWKGSPNFEGEAARADHFRLER
jgi:hypothetical protein